MTVRSAGRQARLTGVGCTRFGEISGSSWLSHHADAARDALADAGLLKADIDGIICAYSLGREGPALDLPACSIYRGLVAGSRAGVLRPRNPVTEGKAT